MAYDELKFYWKISSSCDYSLNFFFSVQKENHFGSVLYCLLQACLLDMSKDLSQNMNFYRHWLWLYFYYTDQQISQWISLGFCMRRCFWGLNIIEMPMCFHHQMVYESEAHQRMTVQHFFSGSSSSFGSTLSSTKYRLVWTIWVPGKLVGMKRGQINETYIWSAALLCKRDQISISYVACTAQ